MPRISTTTVDGRSILVQDFRDLQTLADAQAAFDESRETVRRFAPGSALILTDFTGSRFTPEMVEAAKALAAENRPYVRASALVGLSALQRVLFSGVNRTAERDIHWFDDVGAARAWLLQQDAA